MAAAKVEEVYPELAGQRLQRLRRAALQGGRPVGPSTGQVRRMLVIVRHLIEGGVVTSHWIRKRFDVSQNVAMRDRRLVQQYLPVQIYTEFLGDRSVGGGMHKALRLFSPTRGQLRRARQRNSTT